MARRTISMSHALAAHALAARVIRRLAPQCVVPDPVLVEVDHILRARGWGVQCGALLNDVRDGTLRRIPLDDDLYARALVYDATYAEHDLGLADATVMAVAERERAAVLTFDFRDLGATEPLRGGSWRMVVTKAEFHRALA